MNADADASPMHVRRVHHAQITAPRGSEDLVRAFYAGVLGLTEVEKPRSLRARGGVWFQVGSFQVHVGVEEGDARVGTKAHLAYEVDDLEAWRERLQREGIAVRDGVPIPGHRRFELRDPFGNRVELIQPGPSEAPETEGRAG